ncbi:hypothetical protein K7I13_02925 [Brucepastera parasyntrophica]|uniref:hypothetical protein n=1 Tax=Brucepastera parasyntrophica TaxID=2880008 RepID=UPI00210E3F60|nr:hypothetical protein [Brucepastera parasyntrophica]ULQ60282.1 hypothetical protein K7I13_02925 [Brucepastera parasyntrophica]
MKKLPLWFIKIHILLILICIFSSGCITTQPQKQIQNEETIPTHAPEPPPEPLTLEMVKSSTIIFRGSPRINIFYDTEFEEIEFPVTIDDFYFNRSLIFFNYSSNTNDIHDEIIEYIYKDFEYTFYEKKANSKEASRQVFTLVFLKTIKSPNEITHSEEIKIEFIYEESLHISNAQSPNCITDFLQNVNTIPPYEKEKEKKRKFEEMSEKDRFMESFVQFSPGIFDGKITVYELFFADELKTLEEGYCKYEDIIINNHKFIITFIVESKEMGTVIIKYNFLRMDYNVVFLETVSLFSNKEPKANGILTKFADKVYAVQIINAFRK